MSNKKIVNFRNVPLYLLAISNFAYAVRHGFSWLTLVALILTAVVLIFDIVEVVRHGKK